MSSVSTLSVPLALSFSAQTEKGSALHEAALYGKTDVVQKLLSAGQSSATQAHLNDLLLLINTASLKYILFTLECSCCHASGIDVNIVDQKGLTALDIVKDMPSQKSREIAALILGENPICENRELWCEVSS